MNVKIKRKPKCGKRNRTGSGHRASVRYVKTSRPPFLSHEALICLYHGGIKTKIKMIKVHTEPTPRQKYQKKIKIPKKGEKRNPPPATTRARHWREKTRSMYGMNHLHSNFFLPFGMDLRIHITRFFKHFIEFSNQHLFSEITVFFKRHIFL